MATFFGHQIVLPLSIGFDSDELVTDLQGLGRQTVSGLNNRWKMRFALEPMKDSGPLLALYATYGRSKQFSFALPDELRPAQDRGVAVTAVAAGATTLPVSAAYPAEELYRFVSIVNNDEKVYLVTAATSSTITIAPALRKAIPKNSTAGLSIRPTMQCYFTRIPELTYQGNGLIQPTVELVEAVS